MADAERSMITDVSAMLDDVALDAEMIGSLLTIGETLAYELSQDEPVLVNDELVGAIELHNLFRAAGICHGLARDRLIDANAIVSRIASRLPREEAPSAPVIDFHQAYEDVLAGKRGRRRERRDKIDDRPTPPGAA